MCNDSYPVSTLIDAVRCWESFHCFVSKSLRHRHENFPIIDFQCFCSHSYSVYEGAICNTEMEELA